MAPVDGLLHLLLEAGCISSGGQASRLLSCSWIMKWVPLRQCVGCYFCCRSNGGRFLVYLNSWRMQVLFLGSNGLDARVRSDG